jgi:hypothetical protein
MILFAITLGVFCFVILIMSIGVLVGNHQIRGSCGGPGGCELCLLKHGEKGACGLPCEDAGECNGNAGGVGEDVMG